ncbi:hypothetical protein CANMA_004091 [Candida margitis]|uniref:uncharacterized protein n=1 Tax=Candida margitis TaxID=1775924 RepID=UPI002227A296|nr:uncharacterized protein CANMA_004091 [Candida margitis]KAI5959655.1 hypothetical protein CANMA_004091 [Candida margitis]
MTSIVKAQVSDVITEVESAVSRISTKSSSKPLNLQSGDDVSVRLASINLGYHLEDDEIEKGIVNVKSSGLEKTVFHTEGVTINSVKGSMKDTENNKIDDYTESAINYPRKENEPAFVNIEPTSPSELAASLPPYKCYTTNFKDVQSLKSKQGGFINSVTRVDENKFNPVSKTLSMETNVRQFKLSSNTVPHCYSPLLANSPIGDESQKNQVNFWINNDYDQFFGVNNFKREIELAKAMRFDDGVVPGLTGEHAIYINTRIINPDKILNAYLKEGMNKKDLFIDLILNNKGCNILLQLLKYFKYNDTKLKSRIGSIYIRISASYVNQMKVLFNLLVENDVFYQKVKSLGLFVGLHQYGNGYVFGSPEDISIKLPSMLEKLVVANGMSLADFALLPVSIQEITLHNVGGVNFSRFNLNKNLKQLSISGGGPFNNRSEKFPKGFLELEKLRLESPVVANFNFKRFTHLSTLSLSNLTFANTKVLTFPVLLKKLELVDCCISSQASAFPDTLRILTVINGKWSSKTCIFNKLQRFRVENCEVKDLHEKIECCKSLLKLEVTNCFIDMSKFKFPHSLKVLKLIGISLKGIKVSAFPPLLEVVNLEANDFALVLPKLKLKAVRIASNRLFGDVALQDVSAQDVILSDNAKLEGVTLSPQTNYLNVTNTPVVSLVGHGLTKLILDGCKEFKWQEFRVPPQLLQLSMKECNFVEVDYKEVNRSLRTINLSRNKLTRLDLRNFTELQDIDVSHNNLSKLNAEDFPSSTTSINAKNNVIAEVSLFSLTNLEWLEISENELTRISELGMPDELRTLIANDNNFKEVTAEGFRLPTNLRHLELNRCKISKFVAAFPPKLMSCSLIENQLRETEFSVSFTAPPSNLKFLDLSSNYFKSFDFEMISGVGMELSEINFANNMFDEVPKIPGNILSAILFKK